MTNIKQLNWKTFFNSALNILQQNFPGHTIPLAPIIKPPSFQEFAMNSNDRRSSARLKPKEPILNTEIQQMAREEYAESVQAVAQAASSLRGLRLPKSLSEQVDLLESTAVKTKQSFGSQPDTSKHPQHNTANDNHSAQDHQPDSEQSASHSDQIAIPPAPAPGGSLPGTSTTSSSTNNQSETSHPVDTQVLTESEQPKPPDQPPKTSTAASLSSQLPTTTKSLEIPTPQPNDSSSQPNQPKLTIIE
ncbi:hypothetical protein MJO28_016952 [Puccinia striiformis f. sp. tritici]|nr:hypothetical protein MJO28_016952 [Puccinia striiformis f. sp. tritici]